MKKTKTRNIIREDGGKPFEVHAHIILKNFWEYYLGKPDKNGIAYGYVMGFENEWGDVSLEEIKPYIITATRELGDVMPPAGYRWEDEKTFTPSGIPVHTALRKF
jgi:hypothetical protein